MVLSVAGMKSPRRFWTYDVRSYSHFWEANSAVQTTSEEKTSQSPDFACSRWTNWLRCSSADGENSTSFAVSPCDAYRLLNRATTSCATPGVSLPLQNLMTPGLTGALASSTFAPEICVVDDVPPDPPPPHAANVRVQASRPAAHPRPFISLSPRYRLGFCNVSD